MHGMSQGQHEVTVAERPVFWMTSLTDQHEVSQLLDFDREWLEDGAGDDKNNCDMDRRLELVNGWISKPLCASTVFWGLPEEPDSFFTSLPTSCGMGGGGQSTWHQLSVRGLCVGVFQVLGLLQEFSEFF
jgi:hypothetical protein